MTEAVVFPDTLAYVSDYLHPLLVAQGFPGVRVDDEYRGDRLEVWLQRDGGPVLDLVREVVRLRVNCFADDPARIIPLTQTVSALLLAAKGSGPIRGATRTGGPILITPSVKPQTLMNFELIVRGEPLSLS